MQGFFSKSSKAQPWYISDMFQELILAVIIAFISIVLLLLRANSGVVFFSLSAGALLSNQVGADAMLLSSAFIRSDNLNKSIVLIALTILPAILSAIFMRKSITASKFLLNLIPSMAAAALAVTLIAPLLPSSVTGQVMNNQAWGKLMQLQSVILVLGIISSIILFMFSQKHSDRKKRRRSKE